MAPQDRNTTHALELLRFLEETPYHGSFYHTLRALECLHADKPRLGRSARIADDPIRLAQEPSLEFAPASLASFKAGKNGRPWRLSVYFFGLLGPNGPLPLHLTEYARERLRNHRDPTFARFLDIFHHRMLCLFYRAWAESQPTVSFDRPDSDRFGVYVGSLFGVGMPSLRDRDAMPDLAKLHFAGRLACQTRNAEGLLAMLRGFLRLPVEIQEFIGQWFDLPEDCQCRLVSSPDNAILGQTSTIGSRYWDCQQKFRITVGPVSYPDYRRLLPGGRTLQRLTALVKNYLGLQLAWDLNLVLRKQEVPPTVLGRQGELGWTTWLATGPFAEDADDLLLSPFTTAG